MNKERSLLENPYQGSVHQLLEAAVEEGIIRRLIDSEEISPRDINITAIYAYTLATLQTVADIAADNFSSKERTRQVVKETMKKIWGNCSQETQERLPLENLNVGLLKGLKISNAGGKTTLRVLDLLQKGHSPKDILKMTSLPNEQLAHIRQRLIGWGIDFPYIQNIKEHQELAHQLGTAEDDKTIQELLDQVGLQSYRWLRKHSQCLTPVRELTGDYHYSLKDHYLFIAALGEREIPVGHFERVHKVHGKDRKQGYYFIASQHLEQARKALEENESLKPYQKSKAEQLCGPKEDKMPSVLSISRKKNGLRSVAPILRELGIVLKGDRPKIRDLLSGTNCPIAVFEYRHSYAIREKDEEAFRQFIITTEI